MDDNPVHQAVSTTLSYRSKIGSFFVQSRTRGIFFAFICFLLLGFMPIITNSRPKQVDAISFALYLSLWELLFSLPLLFIELNSSNRGIFDNSVSKDIKQLTYSVIFVTGIIFSGTTFLYVLSFEKAGTVSAAIALQAYPLFSIMIEALALRKMKNRGEISFTIILVAGLYFLGTKGSWKIQDFSGWFALALVVPLLWSIAHVTIRQTLGKSPITPNQITFLRVLISSFVLFIVASSTNGFSQIITGLTNPYFQFFALLMGLFYYLELVFWFYSIKHVDVSVASSITAPNPALTMIFAFVILQEAIAGYQITAMMIVFISLYGLLYSGRNRH